MSKIKIVILPPAQIRYPLAGSTAVASHLRKSGIACDIDYLNIALSKNQYWSQFSGVSNYRQLLPFICLYHKYVSCDESAYYSSLQKLKEQSRQHGLNNPTRFLDSLYELVRNRIHDAMADNPLIIAFSSKFNQWIPAAVCSHIVKSIDNRTITYIGGQNSQSESEALKSMLHNIDLFGWGEGEIPFQEICQTLLSKDNVRAPRTLSRDTLPFIEKPNASSSYINFSMPFRYDLGDYLEQSAGVVTRPIIPIERSRSCNWNKCKFCILSQGYKYRSKTADHLLEEIKFYIENNNIFDFQFFDNNFVGEDLEDFETLLDGLIIIKNNHSEFTIHFAEVITHGLNSRLIEKMALAGIVNLQFGFEAISPTILHKFYKQQTLAENLFFIREAIRFGIVPEGNNIIINFPYEVDNDILESLNNLKYLRFVLADTRFDIQMPSLLVANYSAYMNMVREHKMEQTYNVNRVYELMKPCIDPTVDRFALFHFSSNKSPNNYLWKALYDNVCKIKKKKYNYRFSRKQRMVIYDEYSNDILIRRETINESQLKILFLLNTKRYTIAELRDSLMCPTSEILSAIEGLSELGIVYYSSIDNDVASMVYISEEICEYGDIL